MERLTVVDDTRKIDAIEERNFKSCTASKISIKIIIQKQGQDIITKSHPKLQEHQDDQPTFPQNE